MELLSCQNLSAQYGANHVFSNLSFSLNEGHCLCVLGENGAGKSTLLKCLLGLLKPQTGKIVRNGYLAHEVGYLPQQAQINRDFPAIVWEVVLSGCLKQKGLKPFYGKKEKETALASLEALGIADLKKKRFSALSGGQQQRVLLARALCCAKKLLILDEPAASLDPDAAKEMYNLILRLKQQRSLGIIMVSHDRSGALAVADDVLHLSTDNTFFFGSKEDYRSFLEVRSS